MLNIWNVSYLCWLGWLFICYGRAAWCVLVCSLWLLVAFAYAGNWLDLLYGCCVCWLLFVLDGLLVFTFTFRVGGHDVLLIVLVWV